MTILNSQFVPSQNFKYLKKKNFKLAREDDQILVFDHLKPDQDLDFLEHYKTGWRSAVTLLLLFVIECMGSNPS